jgi:hypothetical protein
LAGKPAFTEVQADESAGKMKKIGEGDRRAIKPKTNRYFLIGIIIKGDISSKKRYHLFLLLLLH